MTNKQKTALYNRHRPAVLSLAHKMSTSRQEFDDLVEEGEYYLAVTASTFPGKWTPNICSERTWFYRGIRWRMMDVLRDKMKRPAPESIQDNVCTDKPPHPWLHRLLNQLGDEAAQVVELVVCGPVELTEDIGDVISGSGPRVGRENRAVRALKNYLQKRMGWTDDQVCLAIAEVAKAI